MGNLKLTISKSGLGLHLILVFIMLVCYHFFYLFKYPVFLDSVTWIYNLAILLFIFSVVWLVLYFQVLRQYRWLCRYLLALVISVFFLLVDSIYRYPLQSLIDTVRVALVFLIPMLSVCFLLELDYFSRMECMLEFINGICLIWNLLLIVQSIVYARSGNLLFDFSSYFIGDMVYTRNSSIRMSSGLLSQYMFIYNFASLCKNRNQRSRSWVYHAFAFVIGMYCVFFIAQTRADEVYILLAIMAVLFIGSDSWKSKMLTIVVLIASLIFIYNNDFIGDFIQSFDSTGINQNGTTHRLYAIEYYLEVIKQHPIFGNAFAMTTNKVNPYYYVEHGSVGWAYYSDVGFLGLLANVGIFGIVVYIIPLIRQLFIIKKLLRKYTVHELAFLIGSFTYMLVSSATLISTDAARMVQFAFIIALFEANYSKLSQQVL